MTRYQRQGYCPTDRGATMTTFAKFDAADYLDNETVIAEYLAAALEDPKPEVLLAALSSVAKARGMSQLVKDTGLGYAIRRRY